MEDKDGEAEMVSLFLNLSWGGGHGKSDGQYLGQKMVAGSVNMMYLV